MPFSASTLPKAGGSGSALTFTPTPRRIIIFALASSLLAVAVSADEAIDPNAYWSKRDVVNPIHDNIFLHVTPEVGHQLIISLVYFSFWLGALGWDIFSTIQFDFRLARETQWRNPFSVLNSVAYVLSRYFTFAWILKCVLDGFTASVDCRIRLVQSASLYGVAVCSTYLVFLLRTMNLWKSKMWATIPLLLVFLALIALCAALPQNMSVERLPGDPFCNYQLGGWLSYAVLGACALFDLLNFVLLGIKLSRSGIKGMLRCLLPQTEANYDHEDVTQMLLQKTGIFTAAQFLLLISIAVIYGTLPELNYQLMQVACFHAISASMAGRIFRRAWRLSREQSAVNINQPPGYQSAWAERAGLGGNGTQGMGGIDGIPVSKKKEQELLRDDDSYVEGEFKLTTKEREKVSSILPRTRPDATASSVAGTVPHTGTSIRSTERQGDGNAEDIAMEPRTIINMDGPGPIPPAHIPAAPTSIMTDSRSIGASFTEYGGDGITFVNPTPSRDSSRDVSPTRHASSSHKVVTGGLGLRISGRGRRASTSAGPSRAHYTDRSVRPKTTGSTASSVIQIISPGEGSSHGLSDSPSQHQPRSPSWQSATTYETSGDSSHSRSLGIREHTSRSRLLGERPKSSSSAVTKAAATTHKDARPAFVASPAMTAGPLSGPSVHAVIEVGGSNLPGKTPGQEIRSPPPAHSAARPITSEGRSDAFGRSGAACDEQAMSAVAGPSSPRVVSDDPLKSFWSTVQADEESHRLDQASEDSGADDGRPRTSRGGPIAPFGHREPRRGSFPRRQSVPHDRDSSREEVRSNRPGTSHGAGGAGSAGTFGRLRSHTASSSSGAGRPVTSSGLGGGHMQATQESHASAIDETYRELERMANSPSVSSLRQDAEFAGRDSFSSSHGA